VRRHAPHLTLLWSPNHVLGFEEVTPYELDTGLLLFRVKSLSLCLSFASCFKRLLGAFAKLLKATVSLFMSAVRPPVSPHGRTRLSLDGF
jgi:hypothetical protein